MVTRYDVNGLPVSLAILCVALKCVESTDLSEGVDAGTDNSVQF